MNRWTVRQDVDCIVLEHKWCSVCKRKHGTWRETLGCNPHPHTPPTHTHTHTHMSPKTPSSVKLRPPSYSPFRSPGEPSWSSVETTRRFMLPFPRSMWRGTATSSPCPRERDKVWVPARRARVPCCVKNHTERREVEYSTVQYSRVQCSTDTLRVRTTAVSLP